MSDIDLSYIFPFKSYIFVRPIIHSIKRCCLKIIILKQHLNFIYHSGPYHSNYIFYSLAASIAAFSLHISVSVGIVQSAPSIKPFLPNALITPCTRSLISSLVPFCRTPPWFLSPPSTHLSGKSSRPSLREYGASYTPQFTASA